MTTAIRTDASCIDAQAVLRFLKVLDPTATTFNLRSLPEAPGVKDSPRSHSNVSLEQVPALLTECAAKKHALFVVVNNGGHQDAAITRILAAFLDLDRKDFDSDAECEQAMRLAHEGRRTTEEPIPDGWPHATAIVASGGGGYHLYWTVDDCQPERFQTVQRALAARFDGDRAVSNLSRVMRLPGGLHWKSGEPVLVGLLVCKPERRYSLDDLLHRLGVQVELTTVHKPAQTAVTAGPATDPVLAYLREYPEHLKSSGRSDPGGPVDVVCPNAVRHSQPDGLTSTIYMPHGFNGQPRAFHCSHSHCADLTLRDFLRHVGYESDCPPLETDDGLACRFVAWLDGKVMYARGQWLVFAGSHWEPNTNAVERLLKSFAIELSDQMGAAHAAALRLGDESAAKAALRRVRAAAGLLQQRKQGDVLRAASVKLYRNPATLDTKHDLLCVPNGAVDLRTGSLLPADPGHGFTMCAGVAYDPEAKCLRWERFIREVFPERGVAEYIQRWAGYALTGHVQEEMMGVWYGQGANGKSVLVEALADVFGTYSIAADPSLLVDKSRAAGAASPEVARLVGRRLCYVNESRAGDRLNDGQVKRLVSTERMTARPLYRDPFEFQPTAKIVLRTNNKPTVQDASDGIWRRLHLVPFTQQFNGTRRDANLASTLRVELPGILAWCVRGAVEWYAKGLAAPPTVVAATEAYRGESDDVAEWIAARVEEGGFTPTMTLLDDYARHAGRRFPPTAKSFRAMLTDRGFKVSRTNAAKGFRVTLRADECSLA